MWPVWVDTLSHIAYRYTVVYDGFGLRTDWYRIDALARCACKLYRNLYRLKSGMCAVETPPVVYYCLLHGKGSQETALIAAVKYTEAIPRSIYFFIFAVLLGMAVNAKGNQVVIVIVLRVPVFMMHKLCCMDSLGLQAHNA